MTSPNEDKIALARRSVDCKGWRWMPGMLVISIGFSTPSRYSEDDDWTPAPEAGDVPDLEDPATLGCLLALVREAWAGRQIEITTLGDGGAIIEVKHPKTEDFVWANWLADGIADALVSALEAAPDHAAASAAEM